jgi:cell division septation protein DedD
VTTAPEQPRGKPAADVPAPVDSADTPDSSTVDPAAKGSEGVWVLNVASSTNVDAIRALMERLGAMGVKSEEQTVTVNGQTRYRLRIPGFETRQAAREFADRHAQKLRIKDPWISKE